MPNCRDCKKPIKFVKLGDRSVPMDAASTFDGHFVLFHESGLLKARSVRLPADQMRPRHRYHFDTCPARRYRKDSQPR